MKIAVVSEWFSEGMGYAENVLPRVLTQLGHQVDVYTSDLQVYGTWSSYGETYQDFLGPACLPVGTYPIDGFNLFRLPRSSPRSTCLVGLERHLLAESYDLVYGFEINQRLSRQLLVAPRGSTTQLFLESRLHKSVFRVRRGPRRALQKFRNRAIGRLVSKRADAVFALAHDVLEILRSEFGIVEIKLSVQGLGVDDTTFFADPNDFEAGRVRRELGVAQHDVLFVYSGRLTREKGVDLLLAAYTGLRQGGRADAHLLLVGDGEFAQTASKSEGVTVWGFQGQSRLASIYRAADMAVWPRQESTSRFDAAACGTRLLVPISAGDRQRLPQTSVFFEPDSVSDLQSAMGEQSRQSLWEDKQRRFGFQLPTEFSWTSIASNIVMKCLQ